MGAAPAAARGMAHLTHWLQTALLVLFGAVGCAAAQSGTHWPLRDFRTFTLRAPPDWLASEGAIDSQAGRLSGPDVTLDYDFGPHADPLQKPFGATGLTVQAATIDGLPARWVRFVLPGPAGAATRSCVGIHVPQVRSAPKGPIRFTALACTADSAKLALATQVLATLRFPAQARP